MPNFHLIFERNQYYVKSTTCDLPDNTLCTIHLDMRLESVELNRLFLGADGPVMFPSKDQAASRFLVSSDKIKKVVQQRKKILIPRRMPYY